MLDDYLGIENIGVVSIIDFVIGIIEITFISIFFKFLYDKYSTSVSNRNIFSYYFVPFSISIFLIVVTIKSSLVLSLGLVGALSIIRFRTAVKETEQLIALLYLTGVSISIAANQLIIPLITTFVISLFFIYRSFKKSKIMDVENVHVSEILKFDEDVFERVLNELISKNNINVKLISVTESSSKTNVVLSFSEINFSILKDFKSRISETDMILESYNIY